MLKPDFERARGRVQTLFNQGTHLLFHHAGLFSCAIFIGYLIVGLWPFNFLPRNRAAWIPNQSGMQFGPLCSVRSEKILDFGDPATPSAQPGSITIELWVMSDSEASENTHTLLSLYDGAIPENLIVAQWESGLLIRTPVYDSARRRRYREVGVDAALPRFRPRLITITSGQEGTAFYLDGVRSHLYPKVHMRSDSLRGRLILGDSPDGSTPWAGKLFGLAILDRSLVPTDVFRHYQMWIGRRGAAIASESGVSALYLFDETGGATVNDRSGSDRPLRVPPRYFTLRKQVLQPVWADDWPPTISDVKDVLVNVAGFVPFGFFYFAYRNRISPRQRWRNLIRTLAFACAISLTIELAQVFLPSRDSSQLDVICNTAGAFGGVIVAAAMMWAVSPVSFTTKQRAGIS